MNGGRSGKVDNSGGAEPAAKLRRGKTEPTAKAKGKAKPKPSLETVTTNTMTVSHEKAAKELLSTISILGMEADSYQTELSESGANVWMTQFLEIYKVKNDALKICLSQLNGFYEEFKANATSAKNLMALKKKYQELSSEHIENIETLSF